MIGFEISAISRFPHLSIQLDLFNLLHHLRLLRVMLNRVVSVAPGRRSGGVARHHAIQCLVGLASATSSSPPANPSNHPTPRSADTLSPARNSHAAPQASSLLPRAPKTI